jgi:hypothetical protein
MLSYNGFSSSERAKVGKIQQEAIRNGSFTAPEVCELCQQSKGQLQLHNEDYSKPFEDAHPICRACHLALHVRFNNPERWEKRKELIRKLRKDNKSNFWWEDLSLEQVDINPYK